MADRRPATSVDVEEACSYFHLAVGQDLAAALRGGGLEIWQPASCPSWPRPRIPAFQVSGLHPARRGGGGAAAAPRLGTHTPL